MLMTVVIEIITNLFAAALSDRRNNDIGGDERDSSDVERYLSHHCGNCSVIGVF